MRWTFALPHDIARTSTCMHLAWFTDIFHRCISSCVHRHHLSSALRTVHLHIHVYAHTGVHTRRCVDPFVTHGLKLGFACNGRDRFGLGLGAPSWPWRWGTWPETTAFVVLKSLTADMAAQKLWLSSWSCWLHLGSLKFGKKTNKIVYSYGNLEFQ